MIIKNGKICAIDAVKTDETLSGNGRQDSPLGLGKKFAETVKELVTGKQDKLIEGDYIDISNDNVISVTDTKPMFFDSETMNVTEDEEKIVIGAKQITKLTNGKLDVESSVSYDLKPGEFVDFRRINENITELTINVPAKETGIVREVACQFGVISDTFNCILQCDNTLYYSNWPDIFEKDTIYQISIVNNCVSVGTFSMPPVPPPTFDFDGKLYESVRIGNYYVTKGFLDSTTDLTEGIDYARSPVLATAFDAGWELTDNIPVNYSRNALAIMKEKIKDTGWRIPSIDEWTEIITALGLTLGGRPSNPAKYYPSQNLIKTIGGMYDRYRIDENGNIKELVQGEEYFAALAVSDEDKTDWEMFVLVPEGAGTVEFRGPKNYAKTILLITDAD